MIKEHPRQLVRSTACLVMMLLLAGCAQNQPVSMQTGPQSAGTMSHLSQSELSSSSLNAARRAFSNGNYGIAISHLEAELAQRPRSLAALNGLGASYDQLGRHEVALRYYFRALEIAPSSSVTLSNLGYSYVMQERFDEAESLLQLSLQHDPNNGAAATTLTAVRELPSQQSINESLALIPGHPGLQPTDRTAESRREGHLRAYLQRAGESLYRLLVGRDYVYASARG